MTTFVEDVLAGRTSLDAVDDYVERWHEGEGGGSLREFLGLSAEEYARWVRDPRSVEGDPRHPKERAIHPPRSRIAVGPQRAAETATMN